MLTDVVGSTRLRVELGDAAANELTHALEATMESVVAAHGGRTVKHLGDGTLAVFESAVEGLAAAADAHVAATNLADVAPAGVVLRIGLAAGDIEPIGDDVHGRAVVAAARLCDRADDGSTLATDTVLDLAAGRLDHTTLPHGPVDLKGLPTPVGVSTVVADPIAPPVSRSVFESLRAEHLVGRDAELDTLVAAWEHESDGGVLVTVTGEAGLGKTALLAAFAERVETKGGVVFYGAADEHVREPFHPWPAALASVLDAMCLGVLAATLRSEGQVLTPLLPSSRDRLGLSPDHSTDWADHLPMTADALLAVVSRVRGVGRTVVILDDMQLCSADAARLLPAVAERLVDAPVVLVVAHRADAATGDHPLAVALARSGGVVPVTEVALHPLTTSQIEELTGTVGPEQAEAIRRRSGGNPFFALALAERAGALEGGQIDDRRADELLDEGIAQLGAEATEVLGAMALIGGEIDTHLLLEVVDLPERDVVETIDHAIAAGILREGASDAAVRFSHSLFAEAVLRRLRGPRRSLLHVRIADVVEAGGGPAGTVASHLLRAASPRHFERVMRTTRRASAAALDAFAYDDARVMVEEVLAFAERVERRRDPLVAPLLSDLSYALYQRGDLEGRRRVGHELHELAAELGDAEMLRHAARAIAGFPKAGEPDPAAEHALLVAIDATPPHRGAARAELLSMLAYYRAINEGKGMEADELAQEAVDAARTADEPFELAEALAARSFVMTGAPPIDEHLVVLDELGGLVDRLTSAADRDRHEQYILRQRGPLRLRQGDRAAFEADHEALRRIAEERHSWVAAATVAMWDGMTALSAGRFDEAEACFERMAVLGDREPNFVNSYLAAVFVIRDLQGRAAELREVAESTVADSPALVAFRPCVAIAQLRAGDRDAASATYRELAADGFAAVPQDFSESFTLTYLTRLALELGTSSERDHLERRLERFAGQFLVAAWGICTLGAADRARAALANERGAEAEAAALRRSAAELEAAVGDVVGAHLLP